MTLDVGHAEILTIAEARCPRCSRLLARNLGGCADLMCPRCKAEIRFSSSGTATVLDKRLT